MKQRDLFIILLFYLSCPQNHTSLKQLNYYVFIILLFRSIFVQETDGEETRLNLVQIDSIVLLFRPGRVHKDASPLI